MDSYAFGDTLFGGWPAWIFQLILPIGFAAIAWRYLVRAIVPGPETMIITGLLLLALMLLGAPLFAVIAASAMLGF